MKKVLIGLAVGAVALAGLTTTASATVPQIELPNGWHVKAEICHNGHSIEVSINATQTQDTGHGELTLENIDVSGISIGADASFVAHSDPPGHSTDQLLRVYLKKGNDERNLDVLAVACNGAPGEPGPEGPAGPAGPAGPVGPQGPAGSQGQKGNDGTPGVNGLTPTILCFPGVGLGYLFNYEVGDELPTGSHVLAAGAICPLSGAAGAVGATGAAGPAGPAGEVGPQGPAGSGTTTTTAPPAGGPSELPHTGNGWLWVVGLGVLGAGLLLLLARSLMGIEDEEEV